MSDDIHTLPYPDSAAEHPTLVLPWKADAAVPAKRRRWPWVLLVLAVLLALLVVAAEFIARSVLPGIVRGMVIEQLDLPADQQLDVEAGGILLPQLIAGRLDELHLSSDRVTLEGITGAADVTATGIPLRGGDLASANGTVRIDQAELTTLLARSELPIESLALEAPNAIASGSISLFGTSIDVSLTLTPGAKDGDVTMTPVSATLGGVVLDAQQLNDRFGSLAAPFTQTQQLCIADQLPAGLTLAGLKIEGTEAVIDVDVNGAIATDPALLDPGVCP